MARKQPEVSLRFPEVSLRFQSSRWAKQIMDWLYCDGRMDPVFFDEHTDEKEWRHCAEATIANAIEDLFQSEDAWELRVNGRLIQGEEYDGE